ncbi:MAG TPA: VOC family protein [Actinomycetota bacterium]|nr:VOC family protein [Actinomycetota bacterium]
MLDRYPPHAMLAASDMDRAKAWYREKLGLVPTQEDPQGAWFEVAGTGFGLFPTPQAGTAKSTVMRWSVDDIEAVVEHLRGRGVTFERFDAPGIEWEGDIASMGGIRRVAWFKDSEGNTLAVSQRVGP